MQNRHVTLVGVVLIWATMLFAPHRARAETIGKMLNTQCPNGAAIRTASEAVSEAAAVHDSDVNALSREAARQYYRCAHVTNNPYVHDWARWFYFVTLWGSFVTKGDVNSYGSEVLDGLSQLAAGSRFGDVRQAATDAYNTRNADFQDVRQQLGPP